VVHVDGSQHLIEVKPARMFLQPRLLERMTEIVHLYQQRGDELRFLLDTDFIPTPERQGVLRDAVHWVPPARTAPQMEWPEPHGPFADTDQPLPVEATPGEGFGAKQIDVISRECDATLESVLSRSFAATVAAARDAQWLGGRP